MKRCPECRRDYADDTLIFCLEDGTPLVQGSVPVNQAASDEPATAILHITDAVGEAPTRAQIHTTEQTAVLPSGIADVPQRGFDKRLIAAPIVLAVIVLSGFFGYRYFQRTESGPINSIAVLPFQNKSGDVNSEYLSDGLAESLIYRLSQLPNLKVSPTSSVIQYKGKDTKVATIASELGVDAVMTGRLAQIGDNLTISVELVDVRNNKLLWGEQYERKMSELLATQREIATEITQKLKLKLSGADEQKLEKKYTNSDEAYQLYLRGRYHFARRSKDDLQKAVDYYQQAIRLDPNFALAYVGICYSYISGSGNYFFPRDEGFPKAKEAALKAIGIDPTLAEAHSAMGYVLDKADWNWTEAERELKRAIELDPKNANAHYYYGLLLVDLGRTADAVQEIKTAVELEPISLIMNANLAGAYMFDGQNDKALIQARKTYDLDQDFFGGVVWLAQIYSANKMYAEVIELYERAAKDELKRNLSRFAGVAYAKTNRLTEAEAMKMPGQAPDGSLTPYARATIYAAFGNKDRAFAELEKAFVIKDDARMIVDPLLADLRDDSRFAALIKRMNYPQ